MSDSPPPGIEEDESKAPDADAVERKEAAAAPAVRPSDDEAKAADPAAQYSQYGAPPGYADYYSYYGYPGYGAPGYGPPPGGHASLSVVNLQSQGLLGPLTAVTRLHHACAGFVMPSTSEAARVLFSCSS